MSSDAQFERDLAEAIRLSLEEAAASNEGLEEPAPAAQEAAQQASEAASAAAAQPEEEPEAVEVVGRLSLKFTFLSLGCARRQGTTASSSASATGATSSADPLGSAARPAEAGTQPASAGPAAGVGPAQAPPATAPASAPQAAGSASQVEERWYCVWAAPGAVEDIRGVHGGRSSWGAISARLGSRYCYQKGHRLRRFASRAEAERAYLLEAPRHLSPLPPFFFWWP